MQDDEKWMVEIHRLLLAMTDFVNRIDVDVRLLADSNVKLDRALFPLLSRLSLYEPMTTADLANLVGRDHSTVSRQMAKLVSLGLVQKQTDPRDARARQLRTSAKGRVLLEKVARVRRGWIEDHFNSWSRADRDELIRLMSRVTDELPLAGNAAPSADQGE